MLTIFLAAMRNHRGAILGWGIGIAALGLLLIPFYDIFLENQAEMKGLLEAYPPEIMAFFGGALNFADPASYLNTYLSFIPVVLGIFTLMVGANMISGDEERGRLDLILAYPISRTALFWGRWFAFGTATLLVILLSYLGFAIPLAWSKMEISPAEMILPFLSMAAVILIFGATSLCVSQLLASKRLATTLSGLLMIAGYFLNSLKNLNEDLKPIARFFAYDYYQGGAAVRGLDVGWLIGLLAVTLLLSVGAWLLFQRRDIRVGGEGGIELPPVFGRR